MLIILLFFSPLPPGEPEKFMSSTVWRIKNVQRLKHFSLHDEVSPASRGEQGPQFHRGRESSQSTWRRPDKCHKVSGCDADGTVDSSPHAFIHLLLVCHYGHMLLRQAASGSTTTRGSRGTRYAPSGSPPIRFGATLWRHFRGDRWRTEEAKNSCWPQTQLK